MAEKKHKLPVRHWTVTDAEGNTHNIEAHYAFDNASEGSGLVFRRYLKNDEHSTVVAAFAAGTWRNFKEKVYG